MTSSIQKIPVTVLTGFLGSGKTTLLNRLLADTSHGKRIVVLENEFSLEIGIEKELVVDSDKMEDNFIQLIEFGNGCVCCSSRGDFERILHELVERRDAALQQGNPSPFDYVVIETTGLADPIFIQSFYQDEHLASHFYLDGIVTVVDAKNIHHHLKEIVEATPSKKNEAIEQMMWADRIIINKVDLIVDEKQISELEEQVKKVNKLAPIYKTTFSNIDYKFVLDIKSFDIENLGEENKQKLLGNVNNTPSVLHNSAVGSVVLLGKGSTTPEIFEHWIQSIVKERSNNIYRIKGLVSFEGKGEQYVLQGVHDHYSISVHPSNKKWESEPRLIKVVFIGFNLNRDELNKSFKETLGIESFWM